MEGNSVQFICIAPFTIQLSLGDIQSQNPQVNTVARKKSLLTGRNLEQGGKKGEPPC